MMLVEEDDQTIDDPRWVPMGHGANLVSARHNGKGEVTFADGHLQPVTPQFGTNLVNSHPLY
jgi:prepilin-type processing-associated H-X9-DG protein